jgi:predicted nuclease with TOPRIM domain
MAGLDNISQIDVDSDVQKQSIEIAMVKLPEDSLETINSLNTKLNNLISSFGQIYIRKREITDEISKLDEILEKSEDEFKSTNLELRSVIDAIDEKYPQGRINLQDGTIQYQPGAPSRKQLEEQQAATQNEGTPLKVVKE